MADESVCEDATEKAAEEETAEGTKIFKEEQVHEVRENPKNTVPG